jgi:hypothetical protein
MLLMNTLRRSHTTNKQTTNKSSETKRERQAIAHADTQGIRILAQGFHTTPGRLSTEDHMWGCVRCSAQKTANMARSKKDSHWLHIRAAFCRIQRQQQLIRHGCLKKEPRCVATSTEHCTARRAEKGIKCCPLSPPHGTTPYWSKHPPPTASSDRAAIHSSPRGRDESYSSTQL